MKVLVTGGAGYVGCVLLRRLLPTTEIRLLDRFSWGTQPLAALLIGRQNLEILSGDVRDPTSLDGALRGVDAVIHLAGIVGYPACDAHPIEADTINVDATLAIAERCARVGIPLLFASTGSCYGKVTGIATEATPINPVTRYGRNKADAERYVLDAGGVCLRLATLYGVSPRMRWDLLPHDFAKTAVRDGSLRVYEGGALRTFLHVEDAAAAFAFALQQSLPRGIYNVGDEAQNCTKGDVAMLVSEQTGCVLVDTVGRDPEHRDYAVSYTKIRRCGWEPMPHTGLASTLPTLVQLARVWR